MTVAPDPQTKLSDREELLWQIGQLAPGDRLLIWTFNASGEASDLARLATDERLVALVYADHTIDRAEGIISGGAGYRTLPSVFDDYQQFAPPGRIPLAPPSLTPSPGRPLSPTNQVE